MFANYSGLTPEAIRLVTHPEWERDTGVEHRDTEAGHEILLGGQWVNMTRPTTSDLARWHTWVGYVSGRNSVKHEERQRRDHAFLSAFASEVGFAAIEAGDSVSLEELHEAIKEQVEVTDDQKEV